MARWRSRDHRPHAQRQAESIVVVSNDQHGLYAALSPMLVARLTKARDVRKFPAGELYAARIQQRSVAARHRFEHAQLRLSERGLARGGWQGGRGVVRTYAEVTKLAFDTRMNFYRPASGVQNQLVFERQSGATGTRRSRLTRRWDEFGEWGSQALPMNPQQRGDCVSIDLQKYSWREVFFFG